MDSLFRLLQNEHYAVMFGLLIRYYNTKTILRSPSYCGIVVKSWRRIEVVITGRTRNALALTGLWVRIPPSPPECSVCKRFLPFAGFFLFIHSGKIFP